VIGRGVCTAGIALALALFGAGCGGEATEPTLMTLIADQIRVKPTDNPPRGLSPGDARTFTMRLSTTSGRPVGRLEGHVIITDHVRQAGQLREYRMGTVQISLRRGTLVASGLYVAEPGAALPASGGSRRPIIGGTDAYRGARGQLTQTALPGNRMKNVIAFETPRR
jgi:hypothetical protein